MKLPVASGEDVIKALSKIGYYVRDRKGSHVHLRHPYRKPLTVPDHPDKRNFKSYNKGGRFNGRRIFGSFMMQVERSLQKRGSVDGAWLHIKEALSRRREWYMRKEK